MNIRLLRKIQRAVTKEPRRFVMGEWVYTRDSVAPCGTAACIAGHAVLLNSITKTRNWIGAGKLHARKWGWLTWQERASKLLRIDQDAADRLFFIEDWPAKFREPYGDSDATDERGRNAQAKLAIKRIEHFIKTKGEE
jgi:hypothetical protein